MYKMRALTYHKVMPHLKKEKKEEKKPQPPGCLAAL